MSKDKVNAYGKSQKVHLGNEGNSRDTDARALAACAHRLEQAKSALLNDPKSKEALKDYGDAVRHNQRLWTIFQVALTDPENPLPADLKVLLLNLSRYVDRTSFRAVGRMSIELVNSLIDINRIIAAGLSKQIEGGSAVSMPMPAVDQEKHTMALTTSA